MTDLAASAGTLTRAADLIERLTKETAPGPWAVSDPNEGSEYGPLWMVTNDAFHNPPTDDDGTPWLAVEVRTGSRAEAEWIATFDPDRMAPLVPALRYAATIAYVAAAADGPTQAAAVRIVDYLAVFARRVLREEE